MLHLHGQYKLVSLEHKNIVADQSFAANLADTLQTQYLNSI
jgi:hypothetical protein